MVHEVVSVEAFERFPARILASLRRGSTIHVIDGGHLLAHLTPLPALPTLPGTRDPANLRRVDQAAAVLGDDALSRVMNITSATYAARRSSGQYDAHVQARLTVLTEALAIQSTCLPLEHQTQWWCQRHPELKKMTPTDHLSMPWLPETPRWQLVYALIHEQRRHNLQPISP